MKTLVLFAVLALGGAAFAQEPVCPMCPSQPLPKVAPQHDCDKCLAAQPCDHCDSLEAKDPNARERAFWAEASKMQASDKVEHGELMACCAAKLTAGKADDCCSAKAGMAVGKNAPACDPAEEAAHHAKKDVKYTVHNGKKVVNGKTVKTTWVVVEGAPLATRKVFAGGQYHFFCCDDMATEAIAKFRAQGMTVGSVQKVVGKHIL